MQYRCYFFGADGQLVGADTIVQENDGDACAAARKLFAQRAHATAYELRHNRRSVETREIKATRSPRAA
ncbi:MAG TPA: hypothetical protein VGL83_17830 [Stellaceae bacterium]|jgi:hypothetical protein